MLVFVTMPTTSYCIEHTKSPPRAPVEQRHAEMTYAVHENLLNQPLAAKISN